MLGPTSVRRVDRLRGGDRTIEWCVSWVALARLLLSDYAILILDEPTEHLDRLTADALVEDLWVSTAGVATLVITHDPALAARCDRVVDVQTRAAVPIG